MNSVSIRHVRCWVKIEGIPSTFEEPDNFKLISDLFSGFLDYDKDLFNTGSGVDLHPT